MHTINFKIKSLKYLIAFLYCFGAFGQENYVTRPESASMLHAGEVPVNLYTGIPDINIPIYTFPTHSKDISVSLGINYHPAGLSTLDQPGSMGRGWNLNALALITRSVVSRPDETYSTIGGINEYDHEFDYYQFSFFGQSGRFRIIKNFQDNTFSLQMMDQSNLKIEYAFNSQNKSIDSFTISDEKGYKYVFDVIDINKERLYSTLGNVSILMTYKSAHYLSKIYDNNGKILVSYSYAVVTKPYFSGTVNEGNKIYNRLEEINITDIGKVIFSYTYTEPQPGNKTPYNPMVKDITIKAAGATNNVVKKIVFTYSAVSAGNLTKVSEFSSDLLKSRDYKMYYNQRGLPNRDLQNLYEYPLFGWLEKIVLPTGGCSLYEFEWNNLTYHATSPTAEAQFNEIYLNSNPDNEIVLEHYGDFTGDYSTSQSRSFPFTVDGTASKKLHFNFYNEPYNYPPNQQASDDPLPVWYKIMSGSTVVKDFGMNPEEGIATLAPGNYTISIITVANLNTAGNIAILHEMPSGPLKKWLYSCGIRIKRIANFDRDVPQHYLYNQATVPYTPSQETFYDYSQFGDPFKSSGFEYMSIGISWEPPYKFSSTTTGYANIKVTKGNGEGYTKYTYAQPYDYSEDFAAMHDFSLRKGILKKAEVYNSNGDLLATTKNDYELIASGDYYPAFPVRETMSYYFSKLSWPRLISSEVTNKLGSNDVITTQSFTYNDTNKKIASKSSTTSLSSETLKTVYTYHTGNSPFSTNRIGLPEKTESFNNSTLLFSEKINYSNAWNGNQSYLPLSISSSKGNAPLEVKTKFSLYDEFGNMLQSEQENGMKTCYIWGYSKTQTVAKIENMDYASIPANLITAIQTATNSGTESAVLSALDALRNSTALSNAMITTYTYKPLIGISTATDPKGDKLSYYYDNFGELVSIRNKDGNIVSEKTTFYKNQN